MGCIYCNRIDGHHYRCPNYVPPKPKHYCSICKYGIQNGEEYIINSDDEYSHFECVDCAKSMAKFLG